MAVITFDQALARIRKRANNEKNVNRKGSSVKKTQLGTEFENMIVHFFRNDNLYGGFKKVERWYDWCQEPDIGIDIVAEDFQGNLTGIQCKCWADDSSISENDFSNMFAVAEGKNIDNKILVFTGGHLTSNAQKVCERTKTKIVMQSDLRQSGIDWNINLRRATHIAPKSLRPHQREAVQKTVNGFKSKDRGKLIMACGTGKTLASLHIAEKTVGVGGLVLYLVPSLSLIPQTMREWADNRSIKHQYMVVCSDQHAGNDEQGSITEIPIRPSTSIVELKKQYMTRDKRKMCVIFSTYNSVKVASDAVSKKEPFDLILFDEAHKTTGAEGIKESYYTIAHRNPSDGKIGVPAKKRLYMTATPRVYTGKARNEAETVVYSMDDVNVYGDVFYSLSFSEAVKRKLLAEYKIIMREIDQGNLYGELVQAAKKDGKDVTDYGDIDMGYMAKIAGVCKGITHPDGVDNPPRPLQRVMVFHNTIAKSKMFAGHGLNQDQDKKSIPIDKTTKWNLAFDNIAGRLMETSSVLAGKKMRTRHVDGSTNSRNRGERIDWLRKSDKKPDETRILSNARCLQEGIDVPALDAVAFMEPRRSPIDIIQSIGRVMRRADGKEHGYVIIPIPVLKGDDPNYVLNKNKRYEQISRIVRAILAHDDSLQRMLNTYHLSKSPKSGGRLDEDDLPEWFQEWINKIIGEGISNELLDEVKTVILGMGDPSYYRDMGIRLGEQAVIIEEKLKRQIEFEPKSATIIKRLHSNLQHVVGSTITMNDAIKALSQHAVMRRIFDALFPENRNPIAKAMESVISKMKVSGHLKELEAFYIGAQADIEHIKSPEQKQEFIKTIYDSFFLGADRKSATKHGIVYTPIEVVDFIINSVQHILKTEFNKSFNDGMVKILDPFTGTGSFIARLLESGLIHQKSLHSKYKSDIYANEIMLPAYYVADSNIEASYQKSRNGHKYVQFDGITYMDTFDQHPLYRTDAMLRKKQASLNDPDLKEAQTRTRRQGMERVNVIIGNPPYSAGQRDANQDNKNTKHDLIEQRIKNTYIKMAPKGNKVSLYNSYIKAIRWASDRIGESGVIGFITPSSYLTGNAEAGIRACLQDDFTDIWILDLLGAKGVPGHGRNIFEYKGTSVGGTTSGVAITILVKNPDKQKCTIQYAKLHETDYSGEAKRTRVNTLGSVNGISDWQTLIPDRNHDWLNQRGDAGEQFQKYMPMGSKEGKKSNTGVVFGTYSRWP